MSITIVRERLNPLEMGTLVVGFLLVGIAIAVTTVSYGLEHDVPIPVAGLGHHCGFRGRGLDNLRLATGIPQPARRSSGR